MLERLYKIFVRPHLEYAFQVWCPYTVGDINELEKVQHRVTRLLPQLKALPYEDRLKRLNLTSLEARRNRGDALQVYKILYKYENVEMLNQDYWLSKCNSDYMNTRSHNMQLTKELVKNCTGRFNFFVNRVVGTWNGLSKEIINATTINSFKNLFDRAFSLN
jgi:hypothetical protein